MESQKYDSYLSAEERCKTMGPQELGQELAREQRSLHLGKDVVRRLRAVTPPDEAALSAEQASRHGTLEYVQALEMEMAKRRIQRQQQPTRIKKLIGY